MSLSLVHEAVIALILVCFIDWVFAIDFFQYLKNLNAGSSGKKYPQVSLINHWSTWGDIQLSSSILELLTFGLV